MKKKRLLEPYEAMQSMVDLVGVDTIEEKRILQFHFKDIDLCCYVSIATNGVALSDGTSGIYHASLTCDFNDWLKLASGRLNPTWGIVSRRLKFQGDSSLFKLMYPATLLSSPVEAPKISKRIAKAPKSVVVLTASPRKVEGYTSILVDALLEGLRMVDGVEVSCLDIDDYKIESCTGCWHCWQRNDGDCIFKERDDHATLSSILDGADLVVYALPLYADGMPDRLKRYFDRHVSSLYPYMMQGLDGVCHPTRRMREDQSLALLSICGFPEMSHFDALKSHFRALAKNDHRVVAAELLRPAVMYLFNNPTLLDLQQQLLLDLREAGRELALVGSVSNNLQRRISEPICTQEEFISFANRYWKERVDSGAGRDY